MAKLKIDTSKIKNFDEMTAEEKVIALTEFEIDDNATELKAALDALEKQKKATDKASSEAAEFKRKLRDKMSADEQAEADRLAELETLKAENAAFKMQSKIAEFKSIALGMGYSEDLAAKRAKAMYDGDYSELSRIDKQFLAEHDLELKAKAVEGTSQPPAGGKAAGDATVTAEQFNKMDYREMAKLQESNPDLYVELSK